MNEPAYDHEDLRHLDQQDGETDGETHADGEDGEYEYETVIEEVVEE